MLHLSAPGKLFISGEWSILEKGNVGLVAAVNRRVHTQIDTLKAVEGKISVFFSLKDFGINVMGDFDGTKLNFIALTDEEKGTLQFAKEAVEIALRYLNEKNVKLRSFRLSSWGEETNLEADGKQQKIGFGSSAAAVVAIVAAVLKFHGLDAEKELIYKLSMIVHYFAQGKIGSGFDVAASTYGGVFSYIAPDTEWLAGEISRGEKITGIVDSGWPLLKIEPLAIPENLHFLVAWTKSSADTKLMVKAVKEWAKAEPEKHNECMKNIGDAAAGVVEAWKNGKNQEIINSLKKSRKALADFTEKSGQPIETQQLKALADAAEKAGAAGKLSGAGGGDCGFAVCFDDKTAETIKNEWGEAGFYLPDVRIDKKGVREG